MSEGVSYVSIGGGILLPAVFDWEQPTRAGGVDLTLSARIETLDGGAPRITSISLTAPPGVEVPPAALRAVRLDRVLEDAVVNRAMKVVTHPDGGQRLRVLWWTGEEIPPLGVDDEPTEAAGVVARDDLHRARRELMRAKGRGPRQELGEEHLRTVARIYTEAHKRGEHPTAAVRAAWFPVHPNTAAKWVVLARKAGFLPPTTRGKVSA